MFSRTESQTIIKVGRLTLEPVVAQGFLTSLGVPRIGGIPLRNSQTGFRPWFDAFEGPVFDRFACKGTEATELGGAIIRLRAEGRHDYPFRERRDMSGDLCMRDVPWDAEPTTADLSVVFEPVDDIIGGRAFTGFRYWFEYEGPEAIHRFVDRQTWEPGGALSDHSICCRNWVAPAHARIGKEDRYSTAGLQLSPEALANVMPMPGNLWARWSLLPGFDMIYGGQGVLLAWYDRVSLVRSVIETLPGEETLRVVDIHCFEQTHHVRTNPKTVVWCPEPLDAVDALNLWTRMTDRDREMSQNQFGIKEDGPPRIEYAKNIWVNMDFDRSYEDVIDVADELGAELVFIDPIWEHAEAFNMEVRKLIPEEKLKDSVIAKRCGQTMCCTMDFRVADVLGGEAGLKALCDRAAAKGISILSWMATHMSPVSNVRENSRPELGHGEFGVFAARESGRHPDTGYAADCWPLNLNAPVFEYVRDQIMGVCQRTGLAGFLWDSFSNLGWWQVDYSDGSLRPQFDRMAELYAVLSNAGLYLMPEAVVSFSNHSCLCLLNANMVEGDREGFMYNSVMAFPHSLDGKLAGLDKQILRGEAPIDGMFRAFAHKWIPNSEMWQVPRDEWDAGNVEQIKRLYRAYRKVRGGMLVRTVLKDGLGVDWRDADGRSLRWCFKDQPAPGEVTDALGDCAPDGGRMLRNHVYLLDEREGESE